MALHLFEALLLSYIVVSLTMIILRLSDGGMARTVLLIKHVQLRARIFERTPGVSLSANLVKVGQEIMKLRLNMCVLKITPGFEDNSSSC